MIPKEILQKVRKIEFKTNRIVNDLFSGQYSSVFKGRGIEFEEVREYVPGDDVRCIDWNVTARYNKLFIKKFVEERELTIMLLLDLSKSQYFGSVEKIKSDIIAEIACILSFSALKNNDKVGAIIFTDEVELYIPPKKSLSHSLRIIREILYYKPKNTMTNITKALEFFYRVQKKKCIAFLFSDFIDTGYEHSIKIVAKKHDLILIRITDPKEREINVPAFIEFEDIETKEKFEIDFLKKDNREKFFSIVKQNEEILNQIVKKYNIDLIDITTDKPYIQPLLKFFSTREQRFR